MGVVYCLTHLYPRQFQLNIQSLLEFEYKKVSNELQAHNKIYIPEQLYKVLYKIKTLAFACKTIGKTSSVKNWLKQV